MSLEQLEGAKQFRENSDKIMEHLQNGLEKISGGEVPLDVRGIEIAITSLMDCKLNDANLGTARELDKKIHNGNIFLNKLLRQGELPQIF